MVMVMVTMFMNTGMYRGMYKAKRSKDNQADRHSDRRTDKLYMIYQILLAVYPQPFTALLSYRNNSSSLLSCPFSFFSYFLIFKNIPTLAHSHTHTHPHTNMNAFTLPHTQMLIWSFEYNIPKNTFTYTYPYTEYAGRESIRIQQTFGKWDCKRKLFKAEI